MPSYATITYYLRSSKPFKLDYARLVDAANAAENRSKNTDIQRVDLLIDEIVVVSYENGREK